MSKKDNELASWPVDPSGKNFTVAERVAIGEAIEKLARKRENFPTLQIGGRITEFAAEKAGFKNRKTYEQAKHVIAAGGKPLADMNRTGRVNGPYKRVKVAGQAAVILNHLELVGNSE
jgi:hypothetical protein